MLFSREELQHIRDTALKEARYDDTNTNWQQAYFKLANAADYLDAMIARTEVK